MKKLVKKLINKLFKDKEREEIEKQKIIAEARSDHINRIKQNNDFKQNSREEHDLIINKLTELGVTDPMIIGEGYTIKLEFNYKGVKYTTDNFYEFTYDNVIENVCEKLNLNYENK